MFKFLQVFEKDVRDRLLIIVDDHEGQGRELLEEEIMDMNAERISTRTADYPRKDLECLIDEDGKRVFVARSTFINLISLEKIKELRESVVLKSVFKFENPLSMQNIALWIVAIIGIANLIR